MSIKTINVQAPSRICLFGDHQDYIGLPIIAGAIDRFMYLEAVPVEGPFFEVNLVDIDEKHIFSFSKITTLPVKGDLLAAGLFLYFKERPQPKQGYLITIHSDIPINAGLSSSSALLVVWLRFLHQVFGEVVDENDIAEMAYQAEVIMQGGSGGRMDQYSIALGGAIYLETNTESQVSHLPIPDLELVVGVSGIPKDTEGLLYALKTKVWEAIALVQKKDPEFSIQTASVSYLQRDLSYLPKDLQIIFEAAIQNHQYTQEARVLLLKESVNTQLLGSLLSAHHEVLRDKLQITVPRIDAMIDAAIKAGAYGAKIVGSGGGGCMLAIAKKGSAEKLICAIKDAGAIDAFSCKIIPNNA